MTMNDADPCDPVLNGDEVRNITFGKGLYDASQVDDLLGRIAAELDAGRPAGPLIASATFKQRPFARGYDIGAVDWFLDQLRTAEHSGLARMNADPWRDLAADPYYIHREPGDPAGRIRTPSSQEYADAWRNFGQQPGTQVAIHPGRAGPGGPGDFWLASSPYASLGRMMIRSFAGEMRPIEASQR